MNLPSNLLNIKLSITAIIGMMMINAIKSETKIMTTFIVPDGLSLKKRFWVFIPKKPTTRFRGKNIPESMVRA